jgi:hypothetical protein
MDLSAIVLLSVLVIAGYTADGQGIPPASKRATIVQRFGLSDMTISYYRPNADGREIFGTLVPYGEVWRTGADFPTFIKITDTTYAGNGEGKLEPGKYALYTIPQIDKWTIIFSRDTTLWGAYGYDRVNDALRLEVTAINTAEFKESFTIGFENIKDDSVDVAIEWANTKVILPLHVDIHQRVLASIKQQMESENKAEPDWGLYWKGARYLLKHRSDLKLAEEWIDRSVKIKEGWANTWTRAQILAAKGDFGSAIKAGEKAISIGMSQENRVYFPYERSHQAEIKKWKTLLADR